MDQIIAQIFHKDPDFIAAHHELKLKEDLNTNSKQYFPIIAVFEDKFEIFMDYHLFQYSATTIETAIEYVISEYKNQNNCA